MSNRFVNSELPPLLGHVCKYMDWKGLAAMLTSIQSAGVAPEVNLRIPQARKYVKGSILALKSRAAVTKSPKQGYQSVAPRKWLLSSKNVFATSSSCNHDYCHICISCIDAKMFLVPPSIFYHLFTLTYPFISDYILYLCGEHHELEEGSWGGVPYSVNKL